MPILELPYVPIINPRRRISIEPNQPMMDLLETMNNVVFRTAEREEFETEKELAEGISYPNDPSFRSNPTKVVFQVAFSNKIKRTLINKLLTQKFLQGYKSGVKYKRNLRIYNGGNSEKKCRFYKVQLDEFHPLLIQVYFLNNLI